MQQQREFVKVIKENELIILKITSVYSGNVEDQKDLYQDIVYQLWKSYGTFKGDSKISTWIYRVALNTAITHFKRNKKLQQSTDFEIPERIEENDPLREEQINQLYTNIRQLNLIEKGLILLFLEGKSYDEIAKITGFSKTNVGTRLGRIKQKLKSQIQNS